MENIILIVHLLIAIALIGVILLQRSEGGALGMGGGGGGGMGGFMTGRATADLLTRTTTVLAACFMASSLTLAILASNERKPSSILDQPRPVPLAPAQPGEPSVPLAR